MKILRQLFHRSKKEKEEKVETVKESSKPSELQVICGDDRETYQALERTLLLDILSHPSREYSIEETLKRAKAKEEAAITEGEKTKREDLLYSAGLDWHLAGQIALFNAALFNGDIENVKEFFGKAKELTGKPYPILAILERAIEKARDFYQKKKEEEEKKQKKSKSVQI